MPTKDTSDARGLTFGAPSLGEEEVREVVDCLRSGWIGTGPRVERFERRFAEYQGVEHVVAVSSCTAALHLSLRGLDLQPGDEVIAPALTYCATINAIIHAGAVPVLADVDPGTMTLDPDAVTARITERTRALLPVHFAGRPAPMDRLVALADRHDLEIVEDCAHAIETRLGGRVAGTFGRFGCFSFYATKNVTTAEGGMVLCRTAEDAARVKRSALHGLSQEAWGRHRDAGYQHYEVVEAGFKYNMTDLEAAVGLPQLARVETNWTRRQELWAAYLAGLESLPLTLPAAVPSDVRHAYHLFSILVDERRCGVGRDRFLDETIARGVGVGVHYRSVPEHRYYRERFGWSVEDYPNAARIGQQTASLPLSAAMTDEDVATVVATVAQVLAEGP